jgi:hypothetical protein
VQPFSAAPLEHNQHHLTSSGLSQVVAPFATRGASVGRGQPRTAALRLKSFRVLEGGASVGRGQPGTAALRLKSFRVLGDGASVRRGRQRSSITCAIACSVVWEIER